MWARGILQALLRDATERLDFQVSRVATHLADTTGGDHTGAQALRAVDRAYNHADESNATPLNRISSPGSPDSNLGRPEDYRTKAWEQKPYRDYRDW